MESLFERIERMRQELRDAFGPDCEAAIAQIDRELEAQIQRDPLLMLAGDLFYRATIALRQQRIDVARRLQSNGIEENRRTLAALLWDSRLIDFFVAGLQRDEKLVEVRGFELKTNQRSFTRDGLKRECRQVSELSDSMFARNFTSDAAVRAAEARLTQANEPTPPGGRGMVSSADWRR